MISWDVPGATRHAVTRILLLSLLLATAAQSQQRREPGNYDARSLGRLQPAAQPSPSQTAAEDALRQQVPDLAVDYDPMSGAARNVRSHTGYLTDPNPNPNPRELALAFARQHRELLGLSVNDLAGFRVADEVHSALSGAHHVYLVQTFRGIPVYNGQLHVNVNRDGRIISLNNAFVPNLEATTNGERPALRPAEVIARVAEHLATALPGGVSILSEDEDAQQTTRARVPELSRRDVELKLHWLPVDRRATRLVWNLQVEMLNGRNWYDINLDADTGEVLTRFDWISTDTFRVYEQPVESPNHTTPLPPADARVLVINPEDSLASPSGWLANPNGVMAGNNVHACADANANNACDTPEPTCSGGTCDFPIDLSSAPSASIPAAITNLFYWNNLIHDVQYQYGFDEAAGNFQEDNFGRGGAGSDSVNADAQDGSGNCNANFGTPADGGNPRMQMFTCTNATPARDGDYDNGVIVHEYGHGISNRQVGGPANVSCLNNTQQAGEGWSDFLALAYTGELGDQGTDARGVGSYLFDLPPVGGTIRDLPYSTDPAINNWTYESISGAAVPHGVGSRWAQAAWEVYWALVDLYGFEPDLENFDISDPNEAGNKRAMFYVNEGLKNTACSPTFVDNRDGIIQAATDNFGGADVCLLWETFAAFGLGTDAVSGGPGSTNPTNGFQIPVACQCQPQPIADAGPDQTICLGESTVVGTPAQPDNTYSWAPGGETTAQITVSPTIDTVFTVTATTAACGSDSDSATVFVDDGSTPAGLDDDFEGDNGDWTATGLWHEVASSTCASPSNGFNSPVTAFYYGQDATCDYSTGAANTGTLTSPTITGIDSSSTLSFAYFRVVESFAGAFDQTEVDIVTATGSTTVFALDSSNPSTAAWVSSGAIGLATFAGQPIQVRFRFNSVDGVANNFTGWFIDDVVVTGTSTCEPPANTAPSVSITAPPDGTTVTEGTAITFTGTASDAEDGDLTASLAWSSSIDGALGSGGSVTATLSVGTHTVTASVTDSGGLSGSASITVTVNANTPPSVSITAPPDGTTVVVGTAITFTGTASDAEDGDLTASLAWSSSIDGALGTGGSVTATLSVGTHTITASVTDSGGLSGSASITVTVNAANTPPSVSITAPPSGTTVTEGTAITFTGTASDAEDGDLTGSIAWSSSIDGALGTGGSVTATLSVGTHTITASVTDSGGLSASDTITVTVNANTPPSVSITAPPSGTTGTEGTAITFTGTASDAEDGDLTGSIAWSSSIDGALGTGGSVTATLSVGTHTITASVTDSGGLSGSDSITVTVNANTPPSVTITAPPDGTTVEQGTAITFTGTASDNEDGDLTASIAWSSSIDGALGTGGSVTATLSVGTHTVTASVTDSGGLSASDSISVTVNPASQVTVTFTSVGAEDGWVRESNENSNVGGRSNSTGGGNRAIRVGDDNRDRQIKSILSFDTSSIPDGATVVSATLRLRRGRVVGGDPFNTHGSCRVDVQTGGFSGSTAVQNSDFEAAATAPGAATLTAPASNGDFSEGLLDAAGRSAVNLTGTTQFRVAFDLDDDNDNANDHMGYFSGDNSNAANHPQLVVTYQP